MQWSCPASGGDRYVGPGSRLPDPLALHDFGRRPLTRAHCSVYPAAHDGRAFGPGPVDPAARLTQRGPELRELVDRSASSARPRWRAMGRSVMTHSTPVRRPDSPSLRQNGSS